MDDSISRKRAVDALNDVLADYIPCLIGRNEEIPLKCVVAIKDLPPVDSIPVVHSEWIPKEKANTPYGLEMQCAKCGFPVIVNDALYFKFCPNCGAKMDGKDGDGNGV